MRITKFRGEFGFLSNMSECEVKVGGLIFNSVEQAYQFHKTSSPKEREQILKSKTPKQSKLISKNFKHVRSDWHEVNEEIMYKLVKIKFTDNDDCRQGLCMTQGIELVEGNWWGDTFWGVCDGVGENKLGKILMKVRDELCINMYKLAIIGSRDFDDYDTMCIQLRNVEGKVSTVVSGGARGADSLGERWAKEQGIPTQIFEPNWDKHGKSAGYIRNREIISNCDACIAFWDGQSKGTQHSFTLCEKLNKPLKVVRYKELTPF